jgi:hypothetical protein
MEDEMLFNGPTFGYRHQVAAWSSFAPAMRVSLIGTLVGTSRTAWPQAPEPQVRRLIGLPFVCDGERTHRVRSVRKNPGATQQAAISPIEIPTTRAGRLSGVRHYERTIVARPEERDLLSRQLGIRRRPRATWMKAGIVVTDTGALTEVE